MRAVILADESRFDPADPNFTNRHWPKDSEPEYSVSAALRSLGHEVIPVPAKVDVVETINNIKAAKPDFVFNLVEEIGGRREHDCLIIQVLELMNIPYTGGSSEVLMLTRNKHLTKLVVADAGVLMPHGVIISGNMKFSPADIKFPAIVKPMNMDGSDGVISISYVKNSAELRRSISRLRKWSPLLCEEYIPGREIIVTISGIKTVTVDSICEMVFPKNSPVKFATDRAKFDEEYRGRYGIAYRTPTQLPPSMRAKVVDAAKRAYRALRINSYAKLEFRVSDDHVVFIEANSNSQMSRFAKSTDFASIGYEKFIRKIVRMALSRPTY